MLSVRHAHERGFFNHGWLQTSHTFSFGDYYDPAQMGFRALRVINEDVVLPGEGFGTHPHRDMEIVTVVLQGALSHRDSMGNHSVIHAGEVQRMTAGRGIEHSEFNASDTEPVHLYQIWVRPERASLTPEYEQKKFELAQKRGRWCLLASRKGEQGSLKIHQDAKILLSVIAPLATLSYEVSQDRHLWVQAVRGSLAVNGETLEAGDGLAVTGEQRLLLLAHENEAEVLLFDLA